MTAAAEQRPGKAEGRKNLPLVMNEMAMVLRSHKGRLPAP